MSYTWNYNPGPALVGGACFSTVAIDTTAYPTTVPRVSDIAGLLTANANPAIGAAGRFAFDGNNQYAMVDTTNFLQYVSNGSLPSPFVNCTSLSYIFFVYSGPKTDSSQLDISDLNISDLGYGAAQAQWANAAAPGYQLGPHAWALGNAYSTINVQSTNGSITSIHHTAASQITVASGSAAFAAAGGSGFVCCFAFVNAWGADMTTATPWPMQANINVTSASALTSYVVASPPPPPSTSTIVTKLAQPVYPYGVNAGSAGYYYAFSVSNAVSTGISRSNWTLHFYGSGGNFASDIFGAISVSVHLFCITAAVASSATAASAIFNFTEFTAKDLLQLDPQQNLTTSTYMGTFQFTLRGRARPDAQPLVQAPQEYQMDYDYIAEVAVPGILARVPNAANRVAAAAVVVASSELDSSRPIPAGYLNVDFLSDTS